MAIYCRVSASENKGNLESQKKRAFVYFADAESNPEPRYSGEGVGWDKVKDFRKHVKQFVLDLSAAVL